MVDVLGPHLKTALGESLQAFAKGKAADQAYQQGKKYPCTVLEVISSGIVKVNYEVNSTPFTLPQSTVPVVGSEYVRLPIKKGDKGMVITADVRLGGITGLGTGVPDLSTPGNLAAGAFIWLGNTEWATQDNDGNPIDPGSVVLYSTLDCLLSVGPAGVNISGPNGNLNVAGNITAGNGATVSVPTGTGQTMMFVGGILIGVF